MKRTELKRKTPLKAKAVSLARTPMKRAKSRKQKRDDAELVRTRPLVLERSQGRCEARFVVCTGIGQHVHHRQLRRTADHRPVNLLHVCLACHDYGHKLSSRYDIGFLVRSNGVDTPDTVPFRGPFWRAALRRKP